MLSSSDCSRLPGSASSGGGVADCECVRCRLTLGTLLCTNVSSSSHNICRQIKLTLRCHCVLASSASKSRQWTPVSSPPCWPGSPVVAVHRRRQRRDCSWSTVVWQRQTLVAGSLNRSFVAIEQHLSLPRLPANCLARCDVGEGISSIFGCQKLTISSDTLVNWKSPHLSERKAKR